jgi:molecular chaperone DnaK
VCIIEGDRPIVIENDGKRTTPSIFAIDKDSNRLVGQPAQRQMVVNPQNTFFGVKRLIGRRYDESEVAEYQRQVPYAIKRGPNGDAWVADVTGKLYSPSEISSFILMKLRDVAEQYLGQQVTRAVITVPAYFDNHQRQATEDAGRIAGLTVERIINEPTAAALAYGINKEEDKSIVVYDLGGGTFDVSILQIGGGVFEVRSTSGDTFLGGEDFNNILANHVTTAFYEKTGVDVSKDKVALQRVREAAELAKHDLSTRESVTVDLPYISVGPDGAPLTLEVTITRAKFEELALPLVKKSIPPCQQALKDAGMSITDITDVIMVGGMTRMPLVRKTVADFFKQEPSLSVNPDEAVAIGAALQGSIIANSGLIPGEEDKELVLVDVTPLNLGIKVQTGELAVIVPAQTAIPCRLSHVFTTAADFQTQIVTEVYQGNRPIAKDNRKIGEYTMAGIPPAPAGIPKIEVIFEISANGTIKVTSIDQGTKSQTDVVINMAGGLSQAQIEKMKKDAEQNRAQDEARQSLMKAKDAAQRDIQHVQKGISSFTSLSPHLRDSLKAALDKASDVASSSTSVEDIEAAVQEMKQVTGPLLTEAYQTQGKAESNTNE